MERKKFRITKNSPTECLPIKEIVWRKTFDGVCVLSGTLPGTGFTVFSRGITIPEEIDGETVTELRGEYCASEIEHIEAFGLKRISIKVVPDIFCSGMSCSIPDLYGCREKVESIDLEFCAKEMHVGVFSHSKVRNVTFVGKVLDDPDWEYGSFSDGIFQECTSLKNVSGFWEGYYLGCGCFDGCISLVSIPILKVVQMGDRIFSDCKALPSIHLSNGLKRMGSYVFLNCVSLRDMYIPDTVESMGTGIFKGCTNLMTIHIPKSISVFESEMFRDCKKLQKIFIPDALKRIGDYAFYGCENLQSPWLPEGLTFIEKEAFFGCSSMNEIWIPQSVTSIGENAFAGCPRLLIKCSEGSIAAQYAKENNIPFRYV